MTSVKKVVINNRTMDVISVDELIRLSSLPNPDYTKMCVERNGYVYPISKVHKTDEPSVVVSNVMIVFTDPKTEDEKKEYSADKIIDFGGDKVKDMRDNIIAADKLRSAETSRLMIINSVLTLPIKDTNTEELKSIKSAINSKHIDADSYKQRFPSDSDFNNDMRALKATDQDNISFFKAKRILNAFDIDMFLTLKDKPNSVNPMGKEITVKLTGGD